MTRTHPRTVSALIVMQAVAAASCDRGATSPGTFGRVGSMAMARTEFAGVLLPNGKALVAGGHGLDTQGSGAPVTSAAELYDPSTGAFTSTGSMTTPRSQYTATALPSGEVLIAGGGDATSLYSAELFDPATDTFAPTGSMTVARYRHTATLLPSGKVLIAGPDASAELYDPANGTFTPTGRMTAGRELPTATLLQTGKVLVAGGNGTPSADLYDPATGTFSSTGAMSTERWGQTATLLQNGNVLVAGGYDGRPGDQASATAEVYDPATGTFAPTGSLSTGRAYATAVLLRDGRVLVCGGQIGFGRILATAELYDPITGTFARAGRMALPRVAHVATSLSDGAVLVTGGVTNGAELEPGIPGLTATATAEAFRLQ